MPRPSFGPWFRKGKNAWYVCHKGRQVNLKVRGEGNKVAAKKGSRRLLAGLPVEADPIPVLTARKAVAVKPEAPVRASEKPSEAMPSLINASLADAEERVKPASLRNYRIFLEPFGEAFKATTPQTLTVAQVERYYRRSEWSQSYRSGFVGTGAFLKSETRRCP